MKLQTLKLENFQGIKQAEFNFNGNSATIYGDNATGKTTVFNAITWLLFDKASTGAKGFTPKTRTASGDAHNLNHSATASFIMDDGRITSFTKTFHEIYKKKKGTATAEFSGHTTDYYIDGVPVKEREYQEILTTFCEDSEKMKMLTMPNYFSEVMSVEARRTLLLEICGDVDDAELIDSTPGLADLNMLLKIPGTTDQKYTVDEYRKLAAERKRAINKELEEIPSRIDEAERTLKESDTMITAEAVEEAIRQTEEEINSLEQQQMSVLKGESAGTEEISKELAEKRQELENIKLAYIDTTSETKAQHTKAVADIRTKIAEKESKLKLLNNELISVIGMHERMAILRESLMNEYKEEAAKVFDESSAICPTCGREYPAERLEEMRTAFNVQKSKKLEEINKRGKKAASKDTIQELVDTMGKLDKEISDTEAELEQLKSDKATAEENMPIITPVEETEEYTVVAAKIAELTAKIKQTENNKDEAVKPYSEQINAAKSKLDELKKQRTKIEMNQDTKYRIQELQSREGELSEQYEKVEYTLYLCDRFLQAKVSSLTQKINDRFDNVGFRLFQTQINGGLKEDCEVLIPTAEGRMIPFTFANNAARINAGLEIISVLSEFWELEMPIFVDNAESVTRLKKTNTQTMRLVVSEQDKVLRLEVDEE